MPRNRSMGGNSLKNKKRSKSKKVNKSKSNYRKIKNKGGAGAGKELEMRPVGPQTAAPQQKEQVYKDTFLKYFDLVSDDSIKDMDILRSDIFDAFSKYISSFSKG